MSIAVLDIRLVTKTINKHGEWVFCDPFNPPKRGRCIYSVQIFGIDVYEYKVFHQWDFSRLKKAYRYADKLAKHYQVALCVVTA